MRRFSRGRFWSTTGPTETACSPTARAFPRNSWMRSPARWEGDTFRAPRPAGPVSRVMVMDHIYRSFCLRYTRGSFVILSLLYVSCLSHAGGEFQVRTHGVILLL